MNYTVEMVATRRWTQQVSADSPGEAAAIVGDHIRANMPRDEEHDWALTDCHVYRIRDGEHVG